MNNLRTTWPKNILIPILSFSDKLLQDAPIIFQKKVLLRWCTKVAKFCFGVPFSLNTGNVSEHIFTFKEFDIYTITVKSLT